MEVKLGFRDQQKVSLSNENKRKGLIIIQVAEEKDCCFASMKIFS